MHHIEADDGDNNDSAADDDGEAVGFCAEVHAEYIRKKLSTTKAYHMINGSRVRQLTMQESTAKQANCLKSLMYLAKIIY